MIRAASVLAILVLAGCSAAPAAPGAPTAPATTEPGQFVAVSVPPGGITGFGATTEAWNSAHTADTRYAPGAAFDPTLGLGSDERYNDRYFMVITDDG